MAPTVTHAAACQAVHEGRQLRRRRVEARQRFHDAKESIVDQFFRLCFAASVTCQFQANGLFDLSGDGEQDALAHVPKGCGIDRDRIDHAVSLLWLRPLRKKRKPLVWLPVMALATALRDG